MGPQLFLIMGLFLQLLSAHELHPRESPDCQFAVAASYLGETCDTFTRRWHIDRPTFLSLNPGADCSGLADDRTYCVEAVSSVSAAASMTTTSSTTSSPTVLYTTTVSSTATASAVTGSSTVTSSTTTDSSTETSSATTDSSTATKESTTPTSTSESSATAFNIPLQMTMIIASLLSLCFI
ncbi:hypothetical protein BDV38DRAFT_254109 [Aspergillus pseudotamarii]|uniref:LysM domain-containing protein n=1 Tax=Aspergillus pseudotamarii TaxID=132259 RepID=A0A5N6SMX8_ASPPS|nr:uncharacterized protein BDV38DRAFT_254109 [Aspergillus pseudotamarii]KAE8134733.1 hypothetical protein BDV38DRAFT_254109 [Aspergillus pseudotamarii]